VTITLHLGVVEQPYAVAVPASARRVAIRTRKGGKARVINAAPAGGETTGDVATILEEKYHIMEYFFEDVGGDAISAVLEHSYAGAVENLMSGAPVAQISLSAEAESEIEAAFRMFLGQQEINGIPGVPTKAALAGVNHRLAHPYAKGNSPRPSFIDTGDYQANFKAWTDE
jgi:hypothetical protein